MNYNFIRHPSIKIIKEFNSFNHSKIFLVQVNYIFKFPPSLRIIDEKKEEKSPNTIHQYRLYIIIGLEKKSSVGTPPTSYYLEYKQKKIFSPTFIFKLYNISFTVE